MSSARKITTVIVLELRYKIVLKVMESLMLAYVKRTRLNFDVTAGAARASGKDAGGGQKFIIGSKTYVADEFERRRAIYGGTMFMA
ncbi:unnamed protein product, partial [Iphiclides podalirius]